MLSLVVKRHAHGRSVGCGIDRVLRRVSGHRLGNIGQVAARQHTLQ